MALTALQVFTRHAALTFTETLRQEVELFNSASQGALILNTGNMDGDFLDSSFFELLSGIVRRRNVRSEATVAEIHLAQLLDTSVRVDAGTPPIRIDPAWYHRIQNSPEEAGVVIGKQMAVAALADMVDVALGVSVAALGQVGTVTNDVSAGSTLSLNVLNASAAKRGDRAGDLRLHVLHSKPMHDLYGSAITNANRLYSHDSVNITEDGFGRRFLVTDSTSLTESGPTKYNTLSLAPGAVMVQRNNDYETVDEKKSGQENIRRIFQAEWSFNVAPRGFAWSKAATSPTNAQLFTPANWTQNATDIKDLGGVLTISD